MLYQRHYESSIPTTLWKFYTNDTMKVLYQRRSENSIPTTLWKFYTNDALKILYQRRSENSIPTTLWKFYTNDALKILYQRHYENILRITNLKSFMPRYLHDKGQLWIKDTFKNIFGINIWGLFVLQVLINISPSNICKQKDLWFREYQQNSQSVL